MPNSRQAREVLASLGVAWGGIIWGLYWIPLRSLDDLGFSHGWSVACFYLLPALLSLPFLLWRGAQFWNLGKNQHITCAIAAFSMALYAASLLQTDVIRAILFFYLTPLWGTILGRFLLKETISISRIIAMGLAFIGLIFMVGGKTGIELRLGDIMALSAGFIWAYASVRLHEARQCHPLDLTISYSIWGAPMAAIILLAAGDAVQLPDMEMISTALPWFLPFVALLMLPGVFTSLDGARHLSPGLVGILFMTEIIVGAVTAAIWAGEPVGLHEWLGLAFILSAGFVATAGQFQLARSH